MRTRRSLLLDGLAVATAAGVPAQVAAATPATGLPRPESLRQDIDRALRSRKALVLMVSLDGCPYCELVRRSYLAPLRATGQPVVQIELALPLPLADARGLASTHAQVASALGVRLAPTVLFLGRGGAELAPRLSGVASPDFYGAYLQERVVIANRAAAN